jgi:hypothetical protein
VGINRRKHMGIVVACMDPGDQLAAADTARLIGALEGEGITVVTDMDKDRADQQGIELHNYEMPISHLTRPAVIESNPHRPSRKLKGRNRRKW